MDRNRRFENRVVLVTGGSRGIGRAIAEGLAAEGAHVAIASRDIAVCQEAVAAIEAAGGRAAAFQLDVTDEAASERVVREVSGALGEPRLLVNAAGISLERNRAERHTVEMWRRTIDVNLTGLYLVARACAPVLLDGKGGAILNVASTTALFATPRLVAYGASKAGVVHVTSTLANEWGDRNVRVNALCAGYVATDLSLPLLNVDRLRQTVLDATPMGRIGELAEVVGPALFLLSDEASFVTGAVLTADGGMSTRGGPT